MDELIKALQLMRTRANPASPFHCEHDVLTVCDVDPTLFTPEEIAQLDEWGFFIGEYDCFQSFKYGSA